MTIVEYILDPQDKPRSYHPKTIPDWIIDGGVWMNPDGSEKMIGTVEEGNAPDSLPTFTLEELQARQRAIHAEYPMEKPPINGIDFGVYMTDDEVNDAIKEWWDARFK